MPFSRKPGYWPPLEHFKATVPFAVAAALAMSTAVGAWAWQFREAQSVAQLEVDAQRLRRELKNANVRSSEKAASAPNFAEVVPAAVLIDPIVSQFQRSGAELGVGFVSVAVAERAPTPQTLGRVQLSVMLRGSYSNIKSVLAEAFDRHPQLILERLTMRRITAPADLEARVDLLLVTRPQFASASAR